MLNANHALSRTMLLLSKPLVIGAFAAWLLIGWLHAHDVRQRREAEWIAHRRPRRRWTRRPTVLRYEVEGNDGL